MFLIFNKVGAVIFLIALISYQFFKMAVPYTDSSVLLFIGVVFIIFDLLFRFILIKKIPKKYNIKNGRFFFLPTYLFGLICLLFGIYFHFNP